MSRSRALPCALVVAGLVAASMTALAQDSESVALLPAPALAAGPDDTFFLTSGSWGQDYEDQWALRRIGCLEVARTNSAWAVPGSGSHSVIVAVIDTGVDYLHPDLPLDSLWRNSPEQLNGLDDDGNGYVDDVIGWDFVEGSNNPWDRTGHGTHVAGIIAAATNNGTGIAGVNPHARIMPLKVLNAVGRGRSSQIAAAMFYAADKGARVINLSLGGDELSQLERRALRFAVDSGALVVVAAGNTSRSTDGYGLADLPGVLTVAATGRDDARAPFSNWGRGVRVAAPGVDILSLRARGSDLLLASGANASVRGSAAVGSDRRYLRASGTSFAAAFVSGVASLLLARNPELSPEQVARVIEHSARDLAPSGVDQLTGYGLVDAQAALAADPGFYVEASIDRVEITREGRRDVVRVIGTADADRFAEATLEILPAGDASFEIVPQQIEESVRGDVIASFDARLLERSPEWTLRLVTRHADGTSRETRYVLTPDEV